MSREAGAVAEQFDTLEQQAHAAQLGMWVFLASELLLFAGLFALYTVSRLAHPQGFAEGLAHSQKTIGSVNTFVLLTSSYSAASAVRCLKRHHRAATLTLLGVTFTLGIVFICLKLYEYGLHAAEGIGPGGHGETAPFWTLYYLMTGLHLFHITAGLCAITWAFVGVTRWKIAAPRDYPLSVVAMYWHLVDIVWIFLWPLFYLTGPS